ncbi:hypothetical protein PG994_014749 [Apiospora phragmitis]|uniref:Uncharacterized protein n=1 Tax=Apiospora phragmitis TaxID=2905665 RepID=A0ABR1SUH6_9PEZI
MTAGAVGEVVSRADKDGPWSPHARSNDKARVVRRRRSTPTKLIRPWPGGHSLTAVGKIRVLTTTPPNYGTSSPHSCNGANGLRTDGHGSVGPGNVWRQAEAAIFIGYAGRPETTFTGMAAATAVGLGRSVQGFVM